MPLGPAADALATLLRYVYRAIIPIIVGASVAAMLAMDASSASQGGRFYVAVVAVVLLGVVDNQLQRLVHRRQPFHIGPTPAERRRAVQGLLLLVLVGGFLFGLAFYLS